MIVHEGVSRQGRLGEGRGNRRQEGSLVVVLPLIILYIYMRHLISQIVPVQKIYKYKMPYNKDTTTVVGVRG
jgi:hypothetical protein